MFTVELLGDKELVARLEAMPAAVQTALMTKARQLAINLQAHVVNDKLHGQVLHQRTGALARSIQEEVTSEAKAVFGRVFSAGDVKYAAFWEYGFHGVEHVRAFTRTSAFGKPTAPYQVGPYDRRVDQDARSYMRTSLADMADEISTGLKEAVVKALQARSQ